MRFVGRVVSLVLLVASGLRADDGAWEELARARDGLAVGALAAEFVQTYVPAGFSSGDEESGRLFLALPECLRWDYEKPYPRRYLLCGQTVWVWSPDETVGDRILSVSREEAGLDFLLLSVERLKERYEATVERREDGTVRIGLVAGAADTETGAGTGRFRNTPAGFSGAEIVLGGEAGWPVALAYTDREGNETRFDLSLYRPLDETSFFEPPTDIEWVDAD